MDPEEQIAETEKAVNDFIATIENLPENLFLKPMNGWSPRDVTAHLIGWNQRTIEGCRQIIRGERPDYFEDADNNYSNLNAESVRTYASQNKINLLAECTDSFRDLKNYLRSLEYQQWVKDYGVHYRDWVITVYNTVLALQKDYESHREEIENWAQEHIKP
ncbi:MAG: ClbS/DfsB family four-helix bundle protein [Anaerolineales bacterium]